MEYSKEDLMEAKKQIWGVGENMGGVRDYSQFGIKWDKTGQYIFMLVGIANVMDVTVIGTGSVLRTAVIFFYLSNEGISLIENAGHLGLPSE